MTSWVSRAAGNRGFSPSTLDNGLALPIDLQQRAESHQETAPSRRDEIIATVTRPKSTRTLAACECWITAAGWTAREREEKETGTHPANQKHTTSRTKCAANSLRRWRGRIVIELHEVSSTCADATVWRTNSHRLLCWVFLRLRRTLASSSCSGHTLKDGNQTLVTLNHILLTHKQLHHCLVCTKPIKGFKLVWLRTSERCG